MPREGTAYRIDDDWRERVEARLKALEMSRAQLAREAGCPRSLITELLETDREKTRRHQTTYLPEIHDALGWDPPQPPLPSKDAGELQYLWERLDETGRERLIANARKELDRLLKMASPSAAKVGKKS